MKFLILRFSSIGDIILTSPVVRCLRKKYPEAEIHYATKKSFGDILQHNPYITKVHLLGESVNELVEELKREKFDYVIDLHHNQRTALIKWKLGVRSTSFNKLNIEKWLMVNFKIDLLPDKHIVDRYLDTCKALEVENDGEGLDHFISKEDEVDINTLPDQLKGGYVAWVIGAKQNTKKFPAAKIVKAISQIQCPVMLLGGKEDTDEAQQIMAGANGSNVFNACGKYSLGQSASLVKRAALVVTNDTGLMHIAAAFKRPVISIWGNTIPKFGMYPYYGNRQVSNNRLEVNGLSCRPCSKLGYSQCPKGHFKCMNDIDELAIAAMIQKEFKV